MSVLQSPYSGNGSIFGAASTVGQRLHAADEFHQRSTIAIPLREPFPDVPLDLQAVLDDVYHRARYGQSIDYTEEIPSPVVSLVFRHFA